MKKLNLILIFTLIFFLNFSAQNCNALYILNAQNGNVYDISSLNGNLPSFTANMSSAARSNLAMGPNPANPSQTVFTSSNIPANSPVYVSNTPIGINLPVAVGGLTSNPIASSPTAGYVYGIAANRSLIKASPGPASNLGVISGDTIWNNGTLASDSFFDSFGKMYTIVIQGTARYLYSIDIPTLQSTQVVQLSGSLPSSFQGLAFFNGNIYAVQGFSSTILLISSFGARIYEINPNTGVSVIKTSYTLNTLLGPFSNADDLDLASCQAFTPTTAPTCNELFGINSNQGITYKINFDTSGNIIGTTPVADGTPNTHGNMSYGPTVGNLAQNQFVASPNNASGRIWVGLANSSNTTYIQQSTSTTWSAPIGIGTDPSTGLVYGINNKALTRWSGNGSATALGNVTGDANWTNGRSLNDIAIDNGGNLYLIISVSDTNNWLYRINPSTLTAIPVTQISGNVPDLTSTNGNGLAYLGDYFYYSRINGNSTDLWKLDAMTGISSFVGSISGTNTNRRDFGDLGSCATVTKVPANFAFDCSSSGGGIVGTELFANGISQNSVLRIPITGAINGLAEFNVSGNGITTSPSPYTAFIAQGVDYIDIPFVYDGSGSSGSFTISVTSPRAAGVCSQNIIIRESVCYEDPILLSNQSFPVNFGITSLGRAGTNTNWPMIRSSAYTALESKTKGFVITRNSNPEGTIEFPVVGMAVFDMDENSGRGCIKIYTGANPGEGWKCFTTQTCP